MFSAVFFLLKPNIYGTEYGRIIRAVNRAKAERDERLGQFFVTCNQRRNRV